jgi:hypothetical protein
VETDLSIDKSLDPSSTGVISTGESIPYLLEVTNNGFAADVWVVDRWDPPDAVVDAGSDEACVTDVSHGVMTCTLSMRGGQIKPMQVVLTPSLLYYGWITNTAQILPVSPFWNNTTGPRIDAAVPVDVQQNMAIWDGRINLGSMPKTAIFSGQTFTYTMAVLNSGPKSGARAFVTNLWAPASAIDGFTVLGGTASTMHLTEADYDCWIGDVEDGVLCEFTDLAVGVPVSVTVSVTTSEQFTDLLEADIYLTGLDGDEGYAADNQVLPVRVGSRPWERVYLPLVMRQ